MFQYRMKIDGCLKSRYVLLRVNQEAKKIILNLHDLITASKIKNKMAG